MLAWFNNVSAAWLTGVLSTGTFLTTALHEGVEAHNVGMVGREEDAQLRTELLGLPGRQPLRGQRLDGHGAARAPPTLR